MFILVFVVPLQLFIRDMHLCKTQKLF